MNVPAKGLELSERSAAARLIRRPRAEMSAHNVKPGGSMLSTARKTAMTVAALGALGLGGAAIAGAADNPSSSPGTSSSQTRERRAALSSDVAAKVKAAALAKVPGATVLETESGGPYNSAYHAHVKTSDGTAKVVLVNASFQATDVVAEQARGGKDRGGHGARETALTGDTK